jgi:tRNA(Arg) A34 adenosine deaminase TadA
MIDSRVGSRYPIRTGIRVLPGEHDFVPRYRDIKLGEPHGGCGHGLATVVPDSTRGYRSESNRIVRHADLLASERRRELRLDHDHFMSIAIDLAKKAAADGNRPIGSVLVDAQGAIVAQGENRMYTDYDPTAHAETVVIREACAKLRTVELPGCTLYTSIEPCPMCCWAIIDSKVSRLVLGGRYAALGRRDMGRYSVETFLEFVGKPLELVTGVKAGECEELRRRWAG